MPCYDGREALERERVARDYQITLRLACRYCHELETAGFKIPSFAHEWWADHKVRDAERIKQEKEEAEKAKLRQQGLAKLTPEERKALRLP